MKMYRTTGYSGIEAREVQRATANSVFLLSGIREGKSSTHQNWHETYAAARAFLIDAQRNELVMRKAGLDFAVKRLERALAIPDIEPQP